MHSIPAVQELYYAIVSFIFSLGIIVTTKRVSKKKKSLRLLVFVETPTLDRIQFLVSRASDLHLVSVLFLAADLALVVGHAQSSMTLPVTLCYKPAVNYTITVTVS